MATIKRFEDMEIWQASAKLDVEYLSLLVRINFLNLILNSKDRYLEAQDLLWIILPKDLNGAAIKSSFNSFLFQKDLQAN